MPLRNTSMTPRFVTSPCRRARNFRRVGLGISVFAILLVLLGLRAYIRLIEQNAKSSSAAPS
jgi:hypothetical protein